MGILRAELLGDVVSSYDQTKTTIQGRVSSKVLNTKTVLGPPLTKFTDVFTDSGLTIQGTIFETSNSRVFTVTQEASGLASLILYNHNKITGTHTYVGRIQFSLPDNPATTYVYRSLKVLDSGVSGWKVFLSVTSNSLGGIYGGTYLLNSVDLSDFVQVGFPTLSYATDSNQKAVYHLQDPANIGVGNLQTSTAGSILESANNRLYVHNGASATHQYYVYDTNISPVYSIASITGSAASDIVSNSGHTFSDNDPIVFTALNGGAGLTVGVTYFVRNSIPGVSFQVSATSGGAALNFTTDIISGSVGRAHGATGSNFIHKTGNLPALSGTLLLNDSEDLAIPTTISAPANPSLAGNHCAFFATSTGLYIGLLSELTSGAVTWPSLITSNLLGTVNQITAPVATAATWSNTLDSAIYITNTAKFVIKKVKNNEIESIFGELNNEYYEGFSSESVQAGLITVLGMDAEDGILLITGGTTGQRGYISVDLRSDSTQDFSYIVTKVLPITNSSMLFYKTWEQLWQNTGNIEVFYRTSGFGSITGGWTLLEDFQDLSAVSLSAQIQFKIAFKLQCEGSSNPAQLEEFLIGIESLSENSSKWEYTHDDSNPGSNIIAWRLKEAYPSIVPNLRAFISDLSGTVVANHTTSANPGFFEYSTDDGVNWSNLGTIPNTVGTLLRYTNNSLPNAKLRPALQEA